MAIVSKRITEAGNNCTSLVESSRRARASWLSPVGSLVHEGDHGLRFR